MLKITLRRLIIICISLFAFSAIEAKAAATEKTMLLEFVQTAQKGNLEALEGKSGQYKLTLYKVDPYVGYFSDRPKRVTGIMPIKKFVRLWNEKSIDNNFTINPPNAAIETMIIQMIFNNHRISLVASLSNPEYHGHDHSISYTINLLTKAPPIKSAKLGFTVLFIDGLGIHWNPGGF